MNNGKLLLITNFLMLIGILSAQFILDTENLKYFDCEDLTSNNSDVLKKLEKQNIYIMPNKNQDSINEGENPFFHYIFNNTRSDENSNSRPGTIKSQNFLKYKNFTLEKNFQIMLKIRKNPEFINNENTEKLNLEKMQKKGLYVWLMRNNKFSFENIRKNIEFNGLAFKIGETDINFITSNKEKNTVIKPFFDSTNDYKALTNQKTVSSNLREEAFKITAVKNLIFVERFSKAKGKWEMAFFENLRFYTLENLGINLEIISDIKDNSESYYIEYLKVCPIKSINYQVPESRDIANKSQSNGELEIKTTNSIDNIKTDSESNNNLDLNNLKEQFESLKILDFMDDNKKKDKFISDFISLYEASDVFLNHLKNDKIKNKLKLLSDEYVNENLKPVEASRRLFEDMHNTVNEFLNKINSTISDSNKIRDISQNKENSNAGNSNEIEMNLKNLVNLANEVNKEISSTMENKHDDKVLENFNLMKTNFYRIDKNLKIIIEDCDKEIKSILNNLNNNTQNDFFIDLVDYLFFFVLLTMLVLLYLIYRYVNFLIDVPKDYLKLSRDINNVEKNSVS